MDYLLLVTIPNNKESPDAAFLFLQNDLDSLAKLYKFEIPAFTVGTLDSLLSLSDDLSKINTQVEVASLKFCPYDSQLNF
jgi:hypothetical protein